MHAQLHLQLQLLINRAFECECAPTWVAALTDALTASRARARSSCWLGVSVGSVPFPGKHAVAPLTTCAVVPVGHTTQRCTEVPFVNAVAISVELLLEPLEQVHWLLDASAAGLHCCVYAKPSEKSYREPVVVSHDWQVNWSLEGKVPCKTM